LLPKIGPKLLLQLEPCIIQSLIDALGIRDVASSACILLGHLLKALKPASLEQAVQGDVAASSRKRKSKDISQATAEVAQSTVVPASNDQDVQEWRKLWLPRMCLLLLSVQGDEGRKRAVNIADYMVPELLKLDPQCVPAVIVHLREIFARSSKTARSNGSACVNYHDLLWALCTIVQHARLHGCAGSDVKEGDPKDEQSSDYLSLADLSNACTSHDIDLRLLALNVISSTQKTTAPIHAGELDTLMQTFRFSLKSPHSEHRQDIIRALKCVLLRMCEQARIAYRDMKKATIRVVDLERQLVLLQADSMDVEGQPVVAQTLDEQRQLIQRSTESLEIFSRFNKWLFVELLDGLYPGTTSDREIICLDLLDMIIGVLTLQSQELRHQQMQQITSTQGTSGPHADVLSKPVESEDIFTQVLAGVYLQAVTIRTLVNLMVRSTWDRTRHMAAELLVNLPMLLSTDDSEEGSDVVIARSAESTLVTDYAVEKRRNRGMPGFADAASVNSLLSWAAVLIGSPRQRESDAGALLLRNIFVHYSVHCQWEVDSSPGSLHSLPSYVPGAHRSLAFHGTSLEGKDPCLDFLYKLSDAFETRTTEVDKLFRFVELYDDSAVIIGAASGERAGSLDTEQRDSDTVSVLFTQPLCHGIILGISYCIGTARKHKLFSDQAKSSSSPVDSSNRDKSSMTWSGLTKRLLATSLQSLQSAMKIVAEAKSDVPFLGESTSTITGETTGNGGKSAGSVTMSAKGPVQSHSTHLAATYMNTNSNMGHVQQEDAFSSSGEDGAGTDEDGGGGDKGSVFQRAVVAAWLMVKEACALIALLVEVSPPPSKAAGTQELLSFDEIRYAGEVILDALGRLKHMGAISEAQAALQNISQHLLA
jgi:hypothetical protein